MTTAIISRLREIREAYAQRQALWRELAACASDGDLLDLEAALARQEEGAADGKTDAETEEIRRFLVSQRSLAAPRA